MKSRYEIADEAMQLLFDIPRLTFIADAIAPTSPQLALKRSYARIEEREARMALEEKKNLWLKACARGDGCEESA